MKKWFISFIIVILPLAASAVEFEKDGLWYSIDETAPVSTATVISSQGDAYTGDIVIPSAVEYEGVTYDVTAIGENAFQECSSITTVTIGEKITSIGVSAFWGCWNLEKVIVTNLSNWCSISFDNYDANPLYHANHLYSDMNTEITNLVIPSDVISIGKLAFLKCQGLTSVTIPNNVTSIGSSAFGDCNFLEKVIVPDISAWCAISFEGFHSNPLYYAHHLYSDENTEIVDLVLPSGLTTIRSRAFQDCSYLKTVTLPNSIVSIEDLAFSGCYDMQIESFPSSLRSIVINIGFRGISGPVR